MKVLNKHEYKLIHKNTAEVFLDDSYFFNKKLKWFPSDTMELFNKNFKKISTKLFFELL